MVSRHAIKRFADELVRRFKPEKVILFGSYAYGKPTPDSDVDLLVVMPHDRRRGRMSLRILEAIHYDFPLDLLVRPSANHPLIIFLVGPEWKMSFIILGGLSVAILLLFLVGGIFLRLFKFLQRPFSVKHAGLQLERKKGRTQLLVITFGMSLFFLFLIF